MTPLVYFDNAATSHPKPEEVYAAADRFQREIGASPGRSGHRLGLAAGRVVLEARERLARLLGAPDPARVVLTANCTAALNLALKGLLQPGDHVLTSSLEHNSVMRPLRRLEADRVIEITVVPGSGPGELTPAAVQNCFRTNTRLVVLAHASNVTGAIRPAGEIAALVRRRGARILVDAAQTAGAVPLDAAALGIDLLAFSGHKGLLGPQGTGGLVLGEGVDLTPLLEGGTGSRSQEERQPEHFPDRLESGTLNGPGIAGLAAGAAFVERRGVAAIQEELRRLTALLLEELARTPGAAVYGPLDPGRRTAVVSFNLAGRDAAEIAVLLDERYGIQVRAGLHCAPAAHRALGTFRRGGAVRASLGIFNTDEQVRYFGQCLREIAAEAGDGR